MRWHGRGVSVDPDGLEHETLDAIFRALANSDERPDEDLAALEARVRDVVQELQPGCAVVISDGPSNGVGLARARALVA